MALIPGSNVFHRLINGNVKNQQVSDSGPLWPSCFCLVFVVPLCASVYLCIVVTCWERADLLALVCGV